MNSPFVSVIIPVKNIGLCFIKENLPSFKKQIYRKFEVIVLPNTVSKDDLLLKEKYPWLRIIPTKKITRPAKKRDIGVQKARGEIIAFIDDDAYPTNQWLKDAIPLFNNKKVVAVCGPGILPQDTNLWEKMFDEVLKTWIGSGEYTYRFTEQKKRYVDDYPSMNFFVLKKEFLSVGGFNNNYWPGEDSKLCEDLVYKKHKLILYSPKILTYHHRRNNLAGYLEQHSNYGFHRGAFFAHGDRNSRRLSYLVPTFFIIYLLFIILYSSFIHYSIFIILYFPLFIYLLFILYLSIRSFLNTKNIIIALFSPFVLFLTHLTYGILFVKGFVTGLVKKERIY